MSDRTMLVRLSANRLDVNPSELTLRRQDSVEWIGSPRTLEFEVEFKNSPFDSDTYDEVSNGPASPRSGVAAGDYRGTVRAGEKEQDFRIMISDGD
jgi:hypothetical protein